MSKICAIFSYDTGSKILQLFRSSLTPSNTPTKSQPSGATSTYRLVKASEAGEQLQLEALNSAAVFPTRDSLVLQSEKLYPTSEMLSTI